MSVQQWRSRVVFLLLLLVIGAQTVIVFDDYSIQWLKATWRTRDMNSMQRSARFLLGRSGLEYMEFLQSKVPPGEPVTVPAVGGIWNEQSVLQFFLMPSGVTACPCSPGHPAAEACSTCIKDPNHFVPAIGGFPPPGAVDGEKTFVQYSAGESEYFHGVYSPDRSSRENITEERGDPEPYPALALVGDLLIVLIVSGLGFGLSALLKAEGNRLLMVGVAYPLGAGVLTWLIFLLSWLGVEVNRVTLGILIVIALASMLATHFYRRGQVLVPDIRASLREGAHTIRKGLRKPVSTLIVLAVSVLLFSLVIISIGRGYSLFDGITNWALKGYAIAEEGSVYAGQTWGGHSLSYPQNLHIQISWFKLFTSDASPGSKLIFPLLLASMLLVCYEFLRRSGSSQTLAGLFALLLLTTPFIYYHGTIGWANLPLASYLAIGTIVTILAMQEQGSPLLLLGGVIYGLSAWTRPEGIGYALVVGIALLLTHDSDDVGGRTISYLFGPTLLIGGTYLVFSGSSIASDEIGGSLSLFLSQPPSLIAIVDIGLVFSEHVLDRKYWLLLFPSSLALLALSSPHALLRRSKKFRQLAAATLIAVCSPVILFLVGYSTRGDLSQSVRMFFDRAFLPGAIMLALLCFTGFAVVHGQPDRAVK